MNTCKLLQANHSIGGSREGHAGHTPSPMGPNSFIFTYIFTKKCLRQRFTPTLMGERPPLREILDPPLHSMAAHS